MIYSEKFKNNLLFALLFNVFALNLIFATELKIGSQIPGINYKLNDISGKQITLGQIKGDKGTLVIFSCNTCPWVLKWEERYVSISKKYKKKGVGIIAVNSNLSRFDGDDSLEKMAIHARENNYNFAYAQDPEAKLAHAFGATKTPHIYLFDKQNNLVYRGAIDDNARSESKVEEAFLKNALDQMLAEKKITKPISKALGCSIKF
tara:strand:+ start:49 stop:663 length:615 start_codon:yes stop_codon:yes gene_type:complete